MTPAILDTATGQIAMGEDASAWVWTGGNNGCECNRAACFGLADELDAAQCKAARLPDGDSGLCLGSTRFIAVDVCGDLDGRDKSELLAAMNKDYPAALLSAFMPGAQKPPRP